MGPITLDDRSNWDELPVHVYAQLNDDTSKENAGLYPMQNNFKVNNSQVLQNISPSHEYENPMARNSSVENFWMLVNMGDIPHPENNVLSETLWHSMGNNQGKNSSVVYDT